MRSRSTTPAPVPMCSIAWLVAYLALTVAVIVPQARAAEFQIVSVQTRGNSNAVTITFSAPLARSSVTDPAQFQITPDVAVVEVSLIEAAKVRLHTSTIAPGRIYVLSVNGVQDTASPPNTIAAGTQAQFFQTQGVITQKEFNSMSGTLVSDLTSHPRFPGQPDAVSLLTELEAPQDARDGYGRQLEGFLTAPSTGDYAFYICSDDQGALYLSTDEDPAHKRLIAMEPQWNSPRRWTALERREPALRAELFHDALFIEGEDFNYGGGRFVLDKPTGMSGPYSGGAYRDLGSAADAEIDWHDADPANVGNIYRTGTAVDVGPQSNELDKQRGEFSVQENFAVGWNNPGDWYNYTRVFPASPQAYYVLARLASGGGNMAAHLDEVIGSATSINQFTSKLGQFDATASGAWGSYAFVPLRNDAGGLATVNLSGERTLRFTVLPGGLNLDYVVFLPANAGPIDLKLFRPVNQSLPIFLEAGRRYYVEALMKEGSGSDNLAVLWRKPGDPEPHDGDPPIAGLFLSSSQDLEPARITTQPQSATVDEYGPVRFAVGLSGTPPFDFQWYQDEQVLIGENGPTLELNSVSAALSSARFHVVCGNGLSSLRSQDAQLTVRPDVQPPELAFAEGRMSLDEAAVGFTEPIGMADGSDPAKFQLSGGLSVLSASLWANNRLVILKTSRQTPGQAYAVSVRGIRDRAYTPNVVASNSQRLFTGFVAAQTMPLSEGYEQATVTTRTGPVTVVLPRRKYEFQPAGVTYYVATDGNDANAGTMAQPWRTFAHALRTLQPGDLLYVRGGDYAETLVIETSGRLGRPIILSAYPGERVHVFPPDNWQPVNPSNGQLDPFFAHTVVFRDVNHVWLHGFDIEAWPREKGRPVNSQGPSAIDLSGGFPAKGLGVRIINNILHGGQYSGLKDTTGFTDYLVEGNLSYDNGYPVDESYPRGAGMYLPGAAQTGTIVRGNAWFRNGAGGFSHYHRPGKHFVYNNISFENGAETPSYGMVTSGRGNCYAHNVLVDNSNWDFSFYDASGEGRANDNVLINSILASKNGWLLDKLFAEREGNSITFALLQPTDRWATRPDWFIDTIGAGVVSADPGFNHPAEHDFRTIPGSPASWAAATTPLLGAKPQPNIGLFPATEYWEPELEPLPDRELVEGVELRFTARITNEVSSVRNLKFLLADSSPAGASIDPKTGVFSWTPDEVQGGEFYNITVIAQEDDSPVVYGARTFKVEVREGNRSPVLGVQSGRIAFRLGGTENLHVESAPWHPGATDWSEDGSVRLTAFGGGIVNDFTADTMRFCYEEVTGDFDAKVRVESLLATSVYTQAGLMVREGLPANSRMLFAITYPEGPTEDGPGFTGLDKYGGDWRESDQASAHPLGSDGAADVPYPNGWLRLRRLGNQFTMFRSDDGQSWRQFASLAREYPPTVFLGLAVNVRRPDAEQSTVAQFRDFQLSYTAPGNVADHRIGENQTLTVNFQATDPDRPAQTLRFSLGDGAPPGAVIDSNLGTFVWKPSEADGGQIFPICVRTTDDGEPPLTAERDFSVTVDEVNSPPVIDPLADVQTGASWPVSFTVKGSDPDDLPFNHVFLSSTGLPAGATFDGTTGAFSWTPTPEQGGAHSITFTATDEGVPPLSSSRTVAITVVINHPPVLGSLEGQRVSEGDQLILDLGAPDIGNTPGILREVFNGIAGVVVSDLTNSAQFAAPPSSASVATRFEAPRGVGDNYGQRMRGFIIPPQTGAYTFWVASDDASILSLSLDVFPRNVRHIAQVINWTDYWEWNNETSQKSEPIALRAGTPYYIEALMKQGGGGDHLSVRWQLPDGTFETPIPRARLRAWVTEPRVFAFDPDLPAAPLIYTLGQGAPEGVNIDSATGALTWTPTEAQGPGLFSIPVRVTDGGELPASAEAAFTVIVDERNQAPVLAPIPDQVATEGAPFTLLPRATDLDLPTNQLAWSLGPGSPKDLRIDPATGLISWNPSMADAGGTYPVTIQVMDDGRPGLITSATFSIHTTATARDVRIADATLSSDGRFSFSWNAVAGRSYQVQSSATLGPFEWMNVGAPLVATNERAEFSAPASEALRRFYRVVSD